MCFSPEASFAGGIIISAIGVATVSKVHNLNQIVFASIPLFFGAQQIIEGLLWLSLPFPEYAIIPKITTYMFLIMAEVLWPIMIPLSMLYMELKKKRMLALRGLLFLGILLSMYYALCLLLFQVTPQIINYHIQYNNTFPTSTSVLAFTIYLVVTITPFFISSVKKTHLLGVLMFLSCLVTVIFFTQFLISVWCFFAALISGVVFWIVHDSKISFNLKKIRLK